MRYLGINIELLDKQIEIETDKNLSDVLKKYRTWILNMQAEYEEFAEWRYRVDMKIINSKRAPEFKVMLLRMVLNEW